MLRKDSLRLGIVLGFLAPILGMAIYYLVQFRLFPVKEFLQFLFSNKSLLTAMLSVSLIANAIVFTYYINTRRDRTARGLFISTCIYAIIALLYKLLA
jgi:hypothetical protein